MLEKLPGPTLIIIEKLESIFTLFSLRINRILCIKLSFLIRFVCNLLVKNLLSTFKPIKLLYPVQFIIKKFLIILFFFIIIIPIKTYSLSDELNDQGIITLMYHRFEENKYPSTNIKLDDFNEQLKLIKQNNFTFVNANNFEEYMTERKNEKKILLTIDDGFLSFYKNAWPILKRDKIPFILFISTKEVNNNGYMNWENIVIIFRKLLKN